MSQALFGPIDQIGYVVDDLDASVAHWIARLGVGPWTVVRNVRLGSRYRGQESVVTMDVAFGYQGGVQIELIQPTNDAPSPYRDEAGKLRLGMHHMAWLVDDLEKSAAQLTDRGMTIVFEVQNNDMRVAYFEADGAPGLFYELIEHEGTKLNIQQGVIATRQWDGTNPITTVEFADIAGT